MPCGDQSTFLLGGVSLQDGLDVLGGLSERLLAQHRVVVPVFVATFVTCNAVGGGIFLDEFAGLTESQSKAYPLGLAMLVAGVLVLAGRSEPVASGKKAK